MATPKAKSTADARYSCRCPQDQDQRWASRCHWNAPEKISQDGDSLVFIKNPGGKIGAETERRTGIGPARRRLTVPLPPREGLDGAQWASRPSVNYKV